MNGRRRPKLETRILSAGVVLAAALFGARAGRAQPLANCTIGQSNTAATIPMGSPGDHLYDEKRTLYGFLAALQPQDVTFPGGLPPHITTPVDHYAQANQNIPWNGASCAPWIQSPPVLSQSERLELERLWMIWAQATDLQESPTAYTLGIHPDQFTLGKIEDRSLCRVMSPGLEWDSTGTWFAIWEYAGNPYFHDPVVRDTLLRRSASWLMVQLLMLDAFHFGSNFPPSPGPGQYNHPAAGSGSELAGPLGHIAYTYLAVQSVLTVDERRAAQTMIRMYAERLMRWGPYGIMMNIGIRSTWGMYLAFQATGDVALYNQYLHLIDNYFGGQSAGRYFPAGYMADHYRLDAGYNGYNIMHAMSILELDPAAPPSVLGAASRMIDLVAHMSYRDPDGSWYSPNEFNTRSSGGAIKPVVASHPRASTGGGVNRYLPAAVRGIRWAHGFLRDVRELGPQVPGGLDPHASTYTKDLVCVTSDPVYWMNHAIDHFPAWGNQSYEWATIADRSYDTPQHTIEHLGPTHVTDWRDAVSNDPTLEELPFEKAGPYIHSLDGEFVFAKMPGRLVGDRPYAVLLHPGPTSSYESNVGSSQAPNYLPSGFGGGQVSMFWGPFTGAASRGMRQGWNNTPWDDWAEWRSWAMHAASFLTPAGHWTSSALLFEGEYDVRFHTQEIPRGQLMAELDAQPCPGYKDPSPSTVTPQENQGVAVLVRYCGKIPARVRRFSHQQDQVLVAPILHRRAMYAGDEGVYVRTALDPQSSDVLVEAWETIPIYDHQVPGRTTYSPVQITFVLANGAIVPWVPSSIPTANVVQVYVARANGAFRVVFDGPEAVRISDPLVRGDAISRNIMVDLGRGALPAVFPATELGYTLEMLTDITGFSPPP